MKRVSILAEKIMPYAYRDSVHAALVAALHAAGAKEADIVGYEAKPWVFAPINLRKDGKTLLKGVTISTSDRDLGEVIERLRPESVIWNSTNGDRIDMGRGRIQSFRNPVPEEGGQMQVAMGSPFVLSHKRDGGPKNWVEDLKGVDLAAAFSSGLTRRHGRPVNIQVSVDAFTLAANSRRNAIVPVRQCGARKVTFPGFFMNFQISGTREDLEAAYFSGVGEKTRYGFGMIIPAK